MPKLTIKERAKFAEVEAHLRAHFSNVVCLWELPKPKGTAYAMLAGFAVAFEGLTHVLIVQVFGGGTGWEIYAAPSATSLTDTFAGLRRLWDGRAV